MSQLIDVTPIGQQMGVNKQIKISVDNIASVIPDGNNTVITLKQVVNGNNTQIKVTESLEVINIKMAFGV